MNDRKGVLTAHKQFSGGDSGKLIFSKDWSRTEIGEVERWPETLSSAVRLCVNALVPTIIWWGRDRLQMYNDACRDLLELPAASMGAKGSENVALWSALGESVQSVFEDGTSVRVTKKISFMGGDAASREFIFYHTPLVAPSGAVEGVYSTVLENTHDRVDRNTPVAREFSEQRYVKMIEEVEDYAIILLDKDGIILNWNKGAQKIKGYKDDEIVGKSFSNFYLDEDRKNKLPDQLIQLAAREGRAMHEGWRKRKDGSRFWGSIVITALHDTAGNVIGFTKVTRDLTERKLAEDNARHHAAQLEIKNKQLEQFAYIASHDLQEPLRKIQTFIQVLERKLGDPEAREKYFNKIDSAAKRMGELIRSVLNYSRLSQSEVELAPTDLNTVFENVRTDYELQLEEKHASITCETLPVVKGNQLQLGQLFANLISNSLKFSKEEPRITITSRILQPGEAHEISPSLDNTKRYARLTFKDNGIGFEQQYAQKIFTIFQRLNGREEYSGTGIGLALCKRITEHHHGHIEATSEPGQGATFVVYLPLA